MNSHSTDHVLSEQELRLKALELALEDHASIHPDTIVTRATTFLRFIQGPDREPQAGNSDITQTSGSCPR